MVANRLLYPTTEEEEVCKRWRPGNGGAIEKLGPTECPHAVTGRHLQSYAHAVRQPEQPLMEKAAGNQVIVSLPLSAFEPLGKLAFVLDGRVVLPATSHDVEYECPPGARQAELQVCDKFDCFQRCRECPVRRTIEQKLSDTFEVDVVEDSISQHHDAHDHDWP
jgi:hypothetical protein